MKSLFRNPIIKGVFSAYFIFMLIHNWVALMVVFLPVIAVFAVAGTRGLSAGYRWRERRRNLRHRFLCPHCLTFEDFQFGCGSCGAQVEELPVLTHGKYVNDCPKCHAKLFSRDDPDGAKISARCGYCGKCCERDVHHNRSVRVLATFDAEDFETLAGAVGASRIGTLLALHDDGHELTYMVNIDDLQDGKLKFPRDHMILNVDVIWLDKAASDPLTLGREIDRFIRLPHMPQDRMQSVTVLAASPSLDPAARKRLELLGCTVRCNVAALDLAGDAALNGAASEPLAADLAPVRQTEAVEQILGAG